MQLNLRSYQRVQQAILHSQELRIQHEVVGGATLVDFGINTTGGIEAGLQLAEICLANLAQVSVRTNAHCPALPLVEVVTDQPLSACIGAQYAGWELKVDDYFAMTSGPIRCLREPVEEIIQAAGVSESASHGVAILESREKPNEAVVAELAQQTGLATDQIAICIAPTASFAGAFQIVARSVETTLHKLHELGFPLEKVQSAIGSAPFPLPGNDDFQALGWTNDCILYGSQVTLWIDADQAMLDQWGPQIPSCSSAEFGKPFLELFQSHDCNFYELDRMLFSPAEVTLVGLQSGTSATFGNTRYDILCDSMNIQFDG